MGGGGGHCCVYGCKSHGKGLSYYKFPSRPWELQRRKDWITAVRKCHPLGKRWEPLKHSAVCNLHFEGGKKSEDPRLNSYIPTIFPPSFKTNANDNKKDDQEMETDYAEILQNEESMKLEDNIVNGCPSIGIQTNPINEPTHKDSVSTHYVWNNSITHEASTQTYVALRQASQSNKSNIIVVAKLPTVTHKPIKLNQVNTSGFMGYSDKISDFDMKELSGINLSMFHTLLKILIQAEQGQLALCKTISRENRLLLFLMKLKLGLAFSTIGIMFNVSANLASGIFENILDILYENVKSWIKWPNQLMHKQELTLTFLNYPKCYSLIDFIEIKTNNQASVSSCAIKFLIAINPSESIIFVSKGYSRETTNEFIINDSGFIDLLQPGDQILSSKEFPEIKSELLKKQCELITSQFSSDPLLSALEVVEGTSIRDPHIEQVILGLNKFKIIDGVDLELLNNIHKIMLVLCAISR